MRQPTRTTACARAPTWTRTGTCFASVQGSEPAHEAPGTSRRYRRLIADTTTRADDAPRKLADGPLGTLRHRQFRRFITGAVVSSIGQFLSGLATPFYMNELTDSNAWVGAAGFAGLAPAVFMTPLAGILSDRLSRRRLLVLAYAAQCAVSILLLVMYSADALTPWRIIFLMLASGTIAGFMFAPIQSMTPILVPPEDLVNGVQLLSIAFTVGRALGPGIGAVVLALSGPGLAYGIASGCYAMATVALFITTTRPQPDTQRASFIREFRDGIAYIRTRPAMRLAIRSSFLVGMFGAVWAFSLAASVADDAYGTGGGGLGLLAMFIGLGSILASVYISGAGGQVRRSTIETTALVLYGCGVLIAASTSWLLVGLLGYLTIGVAHMWHNVTLTTALQVQVDETHRGRVMSVWLVAILSGIPIGAIVGGSLADLISIRMVMAIYGSVILAFTAFSWLRFDRFRPLNRELETS